TSPISRCNAWPIKTKSMTGSPRSSLTAASPSRMRSYLQRLDRANCGHIHERNRACQKVWNFAHVLRDPGVPYQNEERAALVTAGLLRGEPSALPADCRWPVLRDLQGEELTRRYAAILEKLSRPPGIIGTIFLKAQNEIQDPAKLRRLVGLIDSENWLGLGI